MLAAEELGKAPAVERQHIKLIAALHLAVSARVTLQVLLVPLAGNNRGLLFGLVADIYRASESHVAGFDLCTQQRRVCSRVFCRGC